jgi:uncharacterized protein YecE (DUF72 family)
MYDAWKNSFYEGVKKKDWLSFAATRLNTVEVDATFYRQQKPETYANWASQVPDNFKFAVRGHRYLTHRKKLIDVSEPIQRVKDQASGLGPKLGPMLWQVPPFMRKNAERLKTFCQELSRIWPEARHVFEARHESWFDQEIADILGEYRIANCISDAASFPRWDATTTDLVYVRLHGRPHTYWSRYEDEELDRWGSLVEKWASEGREVFVYFDNDANGHAPWDAVRLRDRLVFLAERPIAYLA